MRSLPADLKILQARLLRLNFYHGEVDGKWGPQTWAAFNDLIDSISVAVPSVPQGKSIIWDQPVSKRDIHEIIIHCSATKASQPVTREEIRAWHLARGFNDIGYHYIIHQDGLVEMGRPEARIGAHAEGHNTGSLGVCYIGGLSDEGGAKDTRTPEQSSALTNIVTELCRKYPTIKQVSGHNQYSTKACPSFIVKNDPVSHIPLEKH